MKMVGNTRPGRISKHFISVTCAKGIKNIFNAVDGQRLNNNYDKFEDKPILEVLLLCSNRNERQQIL